MSRRPRGPGESPALDLIEESVHLARRAPLSAWAAYHAGSAPFVLGLLYFWSDMSRGAFAREHLGWASLLLALGYVWMKSGQALCSVQLRALLADEPAPSWTTARLARLAFVQGALQPWALFVRPLALLITIPYGWVFASYQNMSVLGDGSTADSGAVRREALRQSRLWPRQNHEALAVLFAFGFVVWLNVAIVLLATPFLLKSLLGLDTLFSRSAWSLLNTTFLAVTCGITYLCVDPLFKAFYAVRCFHGQSLADGADLRLELRRLAKAAAIVLLFILPTGAAGAAPPEAPPAVAPAELDQHIGEVLEGPRYAWRLPRTGVEIEESERGFVSDFQRTISSLLKPIRDALENFIQWIRGLLDGRKKPDEPRDRDLARWIGVSKIALYVLTAAAALLIGWFLWRRWRTGRAPAPVVATAIEARPDLAADDLVASQLPEDEWMQLASEMIAKGELRLALRALYLAGLAHLGRRELITVARHKSDLDYERELRRRARHSADLLAAFADNVAAFERVWYGRHQPTSAHLREFNENLSRIRAC